MYNPKLTLKEIRKIQTIEDLESLGIGRVYCDISYRGGGVGFYSSDIANAFEVAEEYLPPKFGAGCNYLGGGLRGSIFASDFDLHIGGKKEKLLTALADACVRVYKNIDSEEIPDDFMQGIARINQRSAY